MKKKIFIFTVLSLFFSHFFIFGNASLENSSSFEKKAKIYASSKKFFLLNRIANKELKENPGNFVAAYYKAYSLQKINYLAGLKYYVDFLQAHNDSPESYKIKWMGLALSISNSRNIRFEKYGVNLFNNEVSLPKASTDKPFCNPKILENSNFYFYLAKDGALYSIDKITKKTKKINYYKTRDFVIFDRYLVFNDSINLLKYDFIKNRYSVFHTFEKDEIYFHSMDARSHTAVIKYFESDRFLIKYIDFKKNVIQNLPDNFIGNSTGFEYIVIKYQERFEVLNMSGDSLFSIDGDFLGFNQTATQIFYYKNKYLYCYDFLDGKSSDVVFISNYKEKKVFKDAVNNKVLFCFDDYMLLVFYSKNDTRLFLVKGELLNVFRTGCLYKSEDDNKVYFLSFFDNSKSLIFQKSKDIKRYIFSDSDSYVFLVETEDGQHVNDLREFFP